MRASCQSMSSRNQRRVFAGPNEMAIRVRRAAPWLFQGPVILVTKKEGKGKRKKKKGERKKAKEKRQIESKKRSSTANQNQRMVRSSLWPDVGDASCAWFAEESIASPENRISSYILGRPASLPQIFPSPSPYTYTLYQLQLDYQR